jgi:hypothetical protein
MSKLFLYAILLFTTNTFCQVSELDSLNRRKLYLLGQKKVITDSIEYVEREMKALVSIKSANKENLAGISALCTSDTKFRKNPDPLSEVIFTLDVNKEVSVHDYFNGYFGVCTGNICGYISEVWIQPTDTIIKYKRLKESENKVRLVIYEEQKRVKDLKEKEEVQKKYIKKYGAKIYNRLKNKEFWLGISDEMVLIALGSPDDINRTTGRWGVHEQWVYSKRKLYLYFENYKLTSYQD